MIIKVFYALKYRAWNIGLMAPVWDFTGVIKCQTLIILSKTVIDMGEVAGKICGGASPLDWLIKNYGDDIGRFIAIEKVKQLLDGKVTDAKGTITKESTNVLKQVESTIDGKKVELGNTF